MSNGAKGKYTTEELAVIDLEEIKKMILIQEPRAFDKKGAAKKKAAPKKGATKAAAKAAPKKAAVKKK